MNSQIKDEKRVVRCAIYTRKSTEEGLDQEFNSLDAQREAGENFIASQSQEGWTIIQTRYDDGGYSGGNVDRPAMKRLLDDIATDKIDCVVVYKVDRLSRSLLDFAKIMESFDEKGVSFVSVTQQFNTTHSMGRLTLNILLSFAQFEREIIGERIRDKIAAQRRRGKWAGGTPVLGYDVDRTGPSPRLVVNVEEAAKVRRIFGMYLEMQSMTPVVEELDKRGWCLKHWRTKNGKPKGGKPFDKSSLHKLLTNPIYVGRIKHKTLSFVGEHTPIVDQKLFDDVGAMLRSHARGGGNHLVNRYEATLRGLIYCPACNYSMVHNVARRGAKVYRYYTCVTAIKRGRKYCPSPSLPAAEIEAAVVDQIRCIAEDAGLRRDVLIQSSRSCSAELSELRAQRESIVTQIAKCHEQAQNLSRSHDARCADIDAMASIQERLHGLEISLQNVTSGLEQLEREQITEADVNAAFSDFSNVWNELNVREKSAVLRLLIHRIEFDADESSLSISMHPAGIKAFSSQEPRIEELPA
ncbi:recombinase family protein [Crateriforma spongiae]|uniref:recombinase family protein n=1 Tax=Crateriforma spongiae TaxID=2724528 RepID=UPI0039B0CCE5